MRDASLSPGFRARAGRVLFWSGALCVVLSSLVPFSGEGVLRALRGRHIAAPAASEVLPRLLLVVAATGVFAGALLLSTGKLLDRSPKGQAGPEAPQASRATHAMPDRSGPAAAILLFAVLFGVAQLHLAGRSLGFDEILEMDADVKGPWTQTLAPRSWVNHISGSVLARLGRALFGDSERGLRMPSVLIGSLGIGGLGLWVMRETGSAGAALWLMTALGANGLLLETSMRIRGYSPLMWSGAATILWGASLVKPSGSDPSRGRALLTFLGLLACALLLGLSHLFGLFYLAVFTVLVHVCLWRQGDRHTTAQIAAGALAAATALSLLVCLPAFPWLFYQSGAAATEGLVERVGTAVSNLLFARPGAEVPSLAFLLLPAVAAGWLWRRRSDLRLVLLVGTVPLWCLLAASLLAKPVFFFPRFLLLGLVLATTVSALALGMLMEHFPMRPFARVLATSLLLVVTLGLQAPGLSDYLSDSSGYREVLKEIGELARSRGGRLGAGILPAGGPESQAIVRYYAPRDLLLPSGPAEFRPGERPNPGTVVVVAVGDRDALPENVPGRMADSGPAFTAVFRGSRLESPVRVWAFGRQ